MKKIFVALLCVMFGMNMANAQYYFTSYGSPTSIEFCNSGITTTNFPGYMMVGWSAGSLQTTNVVWTDLSGSTAGTPPYFNQTFTLSPSAGAVYPSRATQVVQNTNNQHFYVVGWVIINATYYPYMMELDGSGNFVTCTVYPYTNSTLDMVQITEAKVGGTGDMFITSRYDHGQGQNSIVAIKVDMGGNVVWANVYDITDAQGNLYSASSRGIVESPWQAQGGNTSKELYIFGGSRYGATGTLNPTVMIIDGQTGTLAPVPVIIHQHGVNASYASCAISNQFGGGFVAAGEYYNGSGGINDYNALTTNMRPLGATNWSTIHDNSLFPGQYNDAKAVKERLNSSQMFETYTTGQLYDMATNSYQMQVLKIDNTGNLINEFLVASGREEGGNQLDFEPFGKGLAVFGTSTTISGTVVTDVDMFTAKMYFNGEMPCSSTVRTFSSASVDISKVNPPANNIPLLITPITLGAIINNLPEHQDCFALNLGNGSNAKTISETDKNTEDLGFKLEQTMRNISIETASNASQTDLRYLICVYDLAGKQLLNTDRRIMPGSKDVISLDEYGLSSGYYLVRVSNNGKTQSVKVFIGQ